MLEKGVVAGIVNIWRHQYLGKQLDGDQWKVGIKNPLNKDKILRLSLEDSAVETSGSYEKYVTFNGKRYSHYRYTNWLSASGIISVSVLQNTELAGRRDFVLRMPARLGKLPRWLHIR
jgi:thiamine biosynthesis lipoprotein